MTVSSVHHGDIVLVPFPLNSPSANQRRPAVVVSGDYYNAGTGEVVIDRSPAMRAQHRESAIIVSWTGKLLGSWAPALSEHVSSHYESPIFYGDSAVSLGETWRASPSGFAGSWSCS